MSLERTLPGIGAHDQRVVQRVRDSLYTGVVEYTDDPRNEGRVKVRIGGMHDAPGQDTPAEELQWARVSRTAFGKETPQVGTSVLVQFILGKPEWPVVMGRVDGVLKSSHVMGRLAYLQDPSPINKADLVGVAGKTSDPGASNKIAYNADPGCEAPVMTVTRRQTTSPTVTVILDSPRGHLMYCEDMPDAEYLKIGDRVGAMLAFHAAVADKGNKNQRGDRESEDGSQPDIGIVSGDATVTLMDVLNQFLRMTAGGNAKIRVQGAKSGGKGSPHNSSSINYIEISRDPCNIVIKCEMNGMITVDSGVNCSSSAGDQMDLHGGEAQLEGAKHVQITAPRIDLN